MKKKFKILSVLLCLAVLGTVPAAAFAQQCVIPQTGGPGTVIFSIIGALLFIAAIVFLIVWFVKRKKENKDEEENDEENDGESCK